MAELLTVFNVGQGDAFLLHPEDKGLDFCEFSATPLLIDTGSACARVVDRIADEKISVLITHSDNDHLGGLASVLRAKEVERLYMPYYLPEMVKIREYLKKHTNRKTRSLNWKKLNRLQIVLLSNKTGYLCNHAEVLNPPYAYVKMASIASASDVSLTASLEILAAYGLDIPQEEIENYQTPIDARKIEGAEGYAERAQGFVRGFFTSLGRELDRIGVTRETVDYYVARHIELTANDASLVFRYQGNKASWLFTGDAGQAVFERLIGEQANLKSDFLKVPHHGSSSNISQHILQTISPKVAIISHGNRKFGRALEAHPHLAVINMLDAANITSYYTNPVKKLGTVIKNGAIGFDRTGLIEFA